MGTAGSGPERGRLHIYLGAAPGVGKTCEALERVRRLRTDGRDAVIGVVESHGRAGTQALIDGLEVVPRKVVEHRGTTMVEMDVAAIIERRPEIVLVDELAHTNVPGSKHVKRWQDVDTLLDAGIDVHSTLNIQHLESINDVVSRITGTEQRETVPDSVVRAAEEIELVDISPEQLRVRLRAGEVYRAERVDAALSNYFRVGNLTALREMALLWLADRVDEALARYRKSEQITDTWEARERVLVAVTGGPESMSLIRRASRIASRSSAELVVVHVLRGDGLSSGGSHLLQVRELAASLGASMHSVVGDNVPETLLDFARGINATQLVLGTSRRSRWQRLIEEGIGSAVLRDSGPIDVHMVTHSEKGRRPSPPRPALRRVIAWICALAVPAAIGGLNHLLARDLDIAAQGSLFLIGVLAVSLLGGVWPAILCALFSGLVLNFFFTEPRYSLTISRPENAFSLVVMVAVAVAVSVLVDYSTSRHRQAQRSRHDAELLTLFARAALHSPGLDQLMEKVRDVYFQDGVSFLSADGEVLAAAGEQPPTSEQGATTAVHGRDSEMLLLTGRRLTGHDRHILEVVAGHASGLVQQRELSRVAAESRAVAEADRLRRSILAAVGHDLRTPLAAAKLAVSSLRSSEVEFEPGDVAELLATTEESVDELAALVDNLLDSSRLAAGVIRPVPRVVVVEEAAWRALGVATVGRRSERERVSISTGGATAWADPGLLERVLGNLIDNALRHAPGSQVRVSADTVVDDAGGPVVHIHVADQGSGISTAARETVFRAFQRQGDTEASSGIGLGLSVARGFTEAMGGEVSVLDDAGPGTVMAVTLPAVAPGSLASPDLDAGEQR